jgi:hypothetical protein
MTFVVLRFVSHSHILANNFFSEAVEFLTEPLGKLTALQQLFLQGNILILIFNGCVALDGA